MRQTVVGVFDRYAQAQHAAQQLRESGFGDSVYVTEAPDVGTATGEPTAAAPAREETGVLAQVRHFFAELFGADDAREVGPYAEAVRRGGAIVKVEVDEDAQADVARSALEAAGAIDIDEKAEEWRASGWDEGTGLRSGTASGEDAGLTARSATGDPAFGGSSERTVLSGTPSMSDTEYIPPSQTTTGPEGERGADEDVIPVLREELPVGKRRVATGGVRVYARSAETPVHESVELRSERADVDNLAGDGGMRSADAAGDDDPDTGYFRTHWQSNYADAGDRYEDYEPAYRWGSAMRSDSRYRDRDWNSVEPDLRSDWEARHTGNAWERFKAAVRHGWDRMTG